MARDRPVSKLELLPIFIQTEIIILLAKHSIDAVRNVLSAFPQLCPSFQQPSGLYKHESPSPNRSIIVISTQVPETDLCLSAGNLDHYYTIKVMGLQVTGRKAEVHQLMDVKQGLNKESRTVLYLVFEYLDTDLKKFIRSFRQPGHNILQETVKWYRGDSEPTT
ncbi:hypothetical protein HID58_065486 [Brassica napus]|uniref:FBD domain-containing protein n=1 Tax=Brassica napus TaxID=3708 RepID=A0ABQ7ZDF4_BRANA|nr:hypothetical protein HID58_065486 [Brassica napus]